MSITGKTAMMLMLADPIDHIRGTALINEQFAALGLDAVIVPIHVRPDDLGSCLDAIRRMQNVRGLGITIPHKIATLPLMDDLTDAAKRLGAVNFVRRNEDGTLCGTNTDGAGFLAGLGTNDFTVSGSRALVVGVGGVGRAIALALADAGLSQLLIVNRDRAKAEGVAREIKKLIPACSIRVADPHEPGLLENLDLLVNATSLGMAPHDPLPIAVDGLAHSTTVAEVVVNPAMTPLLLAAAARGCRVIPGSEMLKPQPHLVAEFFDLVRSAQD